MDLVESYGNKLIEGVDKNDLLTVLSDQAGGSPYSLDFMQMNGNGIILKNRTTDYALVLDCVSKYFEPEKRYYRLAPGDSCEKVSRAFSLTERQSFDCRQCFRECLLKGTVIKPALRKTIKNKIT